MTRTLRYYQADLLAAVEQQWAAGHPVVCLMAPTGAGKTDIFTEAVRRHRGPSCAIAHRDNLVLQLSVALARSGVQHRIIASDKTLRTIAAEHARLFGRTYINPTAQCAVASAQTLAKRDALAPWCATVTLWVTDEGHHGTREGQWGKCIDRFTHPQCKGLLPTATPGRADGKGLGRHADGYADVLVALVDRPDGTLGVAVGNDVTCAPARILIEQGYLSRYKVACVESHITEFLGEVAKSGDWSQAALKSASEHSSIIGDVVASYRQFADGKIGITFATDVETAGNIAAAYRAAGMSAEVLTGETDPTVRRAIFQRLEDRTLQQVVAVDVISEGTDIPAIEVVTFARPTASLGLFLQMLGRALRTAPGKEYAQIIDHVGNFLRHRGGPDTPRTWSLDRRQSRASGPSDATPIRVCLNVTCGQPYERFRDACPFCGTPAPEPEKRGPPDQVEGVLALLDDETLLRLRGETVEGAEEYATRLVAEGLPGRFIGRNLRVHKERLEVLDAVWAEVGRLGGLWRAEGLSDTECQRRFWQLTGVSVGECRGLTREAGEKLLTRLSELG